MRILFFGTYDVSSHPRVAVLIEGFRARNADVRECNEPLGIDTAQRVAALQQPWRLPALALRLVTRWLRLARRAREISRSGWTPDAVVVGYLGHLDVRVARRLFPRTPIVLDHLISAADTARDRGVAGGNIKQRLLARIDDGATRAADLVAVDTVQHLALLHPAFRDKGIVVTVGAPQAWFDEGGRPGRNESPVLRIVFFGLYTPLQATPTIGAALAGLLREDADIDITMVGTGQDFASTRAAVGDDPRVHWIDWVPADELPALVASHDVCLGIFGTGPKAHRVVPNKVFQGAAAGCAVITSDTPPQRTLLGEAAVLVPPGDASALAAALRGLAADRHRLAELKAAASALAGRSFRPAQVIEPLAERMEELLAARQAVQG